MQKYLPKVSILIPTFNRANYLRMAINSAIEQTYPNIEIIVLDDCSADETINMSKEYRNKKNLKFIRNEKNIGFIANWNKGIKLSSGEYIKIIGDDDLLDENCIAEEVKILNKNPDVGIVCCNYFVIDENSVIVQNNTNNSYRLFHVDTKENGKDFIINYLLQKRVVGWPTAILFRRKDVEKVGFFDVNIGSSADIDMWCRILYSSNFYYLDKLLAYCRQFIGNLSKKLAGDQFGYKSYLQFYFKTMSYIENETNEHTKQNIWMKIVRKIYPYYLNAEKENRNIILRDLISVVKKLNMSNKIKFLPLLTKDFLRRKISKTVFKAT